jgi:hypothetical protein
VAAGGVAKWALDYWLQKRNRSTSEYRKQAQSVYDRVFAAAAKVRKDANAIAFVDQTWDNTSWQELMDACEDVPRVAPTALTKAAQDLPSKGLILRLAAGSLQIAKATQETYVQTAESFENAVAILKDQGSEPNPDILAQAASDRSSAEEGAKDVRNANDGYIEALASFERALNTFNDAAKKELGRPN